MGFGKGEAITDSAVKYFTGVENFVVTAVNPSKEELEKLWGREIQFTPEYIGKQTVSDGDGEREIDQVRLDFFLTSGGENPINTKASFYIGNTHHKSQTGKLKVINAFGNDTWLTEADIKANTLPENMQWYDDTDVKIAKRGEVELVDFLKNLLNIAFNNDKLVNKADGHAGITDEQWKKIFSGDFDELRSIVASTNNKVGLALGVKTSTDNSLRQVVYGRKALRQYTLHSTRADKFKYLAKHLQEAQAGGALAQVDFGPADYALREFEIVPTPLNTDNAPDADVFGGNQGDGVSDDLNF
ncbi:MAG: hypothetical protein IMY67_07840 [Bacteroidetes bacterium]|nr:hypothetical protein [Bacteroidota bacterium]